MKKSTAPFQLSSARLLVLIAFIGIFTMAVRLPADSDTWWHLRSGQYMVENRTIPLADPFSLLKAGQLWINHGWLAQLFWYGLFTLGGWAAMSLAVAGLATLSFWLVWRQLETNVFVGAFILVLGAVVASVVWVARPQMISFLLTAVVAYLLHRYKREQGRLLPWLPLIMLLWANIHGGFAIGLMLILAYLAGEVMNHVTGHQDDPVIPWAGLRHLALVFALSLAVVGLNPHTWRMWLYPFQTVGIGALRDFIQEWQSPDFHQPHVIPFLIMLLLLFASLGRTERRADWTDLTLAALWTAWSLFAARNIALFGLIVTPILARYAGAVWNEQWLSWGYPTAPFSQPTVPRNRLVLRLNWLLLGLILLAALLKMALPLSPQVNLQAEQAALPYQAVEFIKREKPPGPMFNSYNWGGYLIFKLWPDYPIYIDGRTDLYDDLFIRRYLRVVAGEAGWSDILAEDQINLVLIERNSTLAKRLAADPAWRSLYQDELAALFGRVGAD